MLQAGQGSAGDPCDLRLLHFPGERRGKKKQKKMQAVKLCNLRAFADGQKKKFLLQFYCVVLVMLEWAERSPATHSLLFFSFLFFSCKQLQTVQRTERLDT